MKNLKIKTGLFAVLLTIGCLQTTQAQSQKREQKKPPTFSELLKDMDKNEDGKLAKNELKGPLKENFSEVDTDEDGFITEEEFKKAPKPKRKEKK